MDHLERNKDAGGSVEVTTELLQSTALPKLVQNATQSQALKKTMLQLFTIQSKTSSLEQLYIKTYRCIVAHTLIGNYGNYKQALFSVRPKLNKYAKGVNSGSAHLMQKLDLRQCCTVCTRKMIQTEKTFVSPAMCIFAM